MHVAWKQLGVLRWGLGAGDADPLVSPSSVGRVASDGERSVRPLLTNPQRNVNGGATGEAVTTRLPSSDTENALWMSSLSSASLPPLTSLSSSDCGDRLVVRSLSSLSVSYVSLPDFLSRPVGSGGQLIGGASGAVPLR